SVVLHTLAHRFQNAGHLGGSFFFKRGHSTHKQTNSTRGNAKFLFVTLAYDLALHLPLFRRRIFQAAEQDPSVVARSMVVQLQKLIIDPCRSLEGSSPAIILIDGLDEC
ncbi:hypothetical protein C8R44DRAFT_540631, partial [Mycena epipterygia]